MLETIQRRVRRMRPSPAVLLTTAGLCLLICSLGIVLLIKGSGPPVPVRQKPPEAVVEWTSDAGRTNAVAISPDGTVAGAVYPGGKIVCWDSRGEERWTAEVKGADSLVLAPGGDFAAAFAALNPAARTVTFLDERGQVHWTLTLSGAVWCADVVETRDGVRFAVGTGGKHVYIVDLGESRKRYRRWRVPGAPVSLVLDPSGEKVFYTCWQESAAGSSTVRGKRLWLDEAELSSLHFAERLGAGDRILLSSRPSKAAFPDRFRVLDVDGKEIWGAVLDPALCPKIVCSPDGSFVCTGYRREIRHEGRTAYEFHTTMFDASGTRLWDKGSLFFGPQPLMITRNGFAVVKSGEKALFAVGPAGDPQPLLKLSAGIVRSVASRDGSRLLLECADGKLVMLGLREK